MKQAASALSACCLIHGGSLLGLLFNNKDGNDMFFRNVGGLLPDYTALYRKRQNSS
jgi:hypothetical protein